MTSDKNIVELNTFKQNVVWDTSILWLTFYKQSIEVMTGVDFIDYYFYFYPRYVILHGNSFLAVFKQLRTIFSNKNSCTFPTRMLSYGGKAPYESYCVIF